MKSTTKAGLWLAGLCVSILGIVAIAASSSGHQLGPVKPVFLAAFIMTSLISLVAALWYAM